jgi:hypothetical protein
MNLFFKFETISQFRIKIVCLPNIYALMRCELLCSWFGLVGQCMSPQLDFFPATPLALPPEKLQDAHRRGRRPAAARTSGCGSGARVAAECAWGSGGSRPTAEVLTAAEVLGHRALIHHCCAFLVARRAASPWDAVNFALCHRRRRSRPSHGYGGAGDGADGGPGGGHRWAPRQVGSAVRGLQSPRSPPARATRSPANSTPTSPPSSAGFDSSGSFNLQFNLKMEQNLDLSFGHDSSPTFVFMAYYCC